MYIIFSQYEKDDDGNPLAWSNDLGWVDVDSATRFDSMIYLPPFGGMWMHVDR